MKKTLLSFVALVLSIALNAQTVVPFNGQVRYKQNPISHYSILKSVPQKAELAANQRNVGFFFDDSRSSEGAGIPQYTSGSCKAAIWLQGDLVKSYEGMKVVAIRFALASQQSKSRVFITPVVGNKIAADAVSKDVASTQVGWNTVTLDEPYTIGKDASFFVGYDYEQKQTNNGQYYYDECFPLSVSTPTVGTSNGGMVIYANIPKSSGGSGETWYNMSADEVLSIQLVVEGNFKEYVVTPYELSQIITKANTETKADVSFLNFSKEAVTDIDYVVSIDGVVGSAQHYSFTQAIGRGSVGTFSATIPGVEAYGKHTLTINITKVNGNENLSDSKIAEGSLVAASTVYPKNVLIEEFTTEKCPNCPRVAGYLKTALASADASRAFAVCHHAGYYTDWLTGTWDNDIVSLVFGGTGSTYAPAMTFNRDYNLCKNGYDRYGVMFMPRSAAEITAYINEATGEDANVKLSISATKSSDDSQAVVTVEGEANEAIDKEIAKLTFYVTEDEIKAKSQSGASGDFYHEHVIRYNNSSWGEDIQWNGNKFTKIFAVPVKEAWVKNNLKFVAFVNNYNSAKEDFMSLNVENVIGMPYNSEATGINGISDNIDTNVTARYSLDGVRLSAPQKGLNIVKLSDGRTVKVMVK